MQDWQFYIDVGGTFTDCIGISPSGATLTHKLLSSSSYKGLVSGVSGNTFKISSSFHFPKNFFSKFSLIILRPEEHTPVFQGVVSSSDESGSITLANKPDLTTLNDVRPMLYELRSPDSAPICGIRFLMKLAPDQPIGSVSIKLGTTKGTNALLERKGARTALITTVGFRDILAISYQNRPKLFALNIRKHLPLYERVAEVSERMDARGRVLIPLNEEDAINKLTRLKNKGIESIAVCFLHSHKNPTHENRIAAIAKSMDFRHISTSSQTVNLQKIVARGDTTVVDAYLTPVIQSYVSQIMAAAPSASIRLMTSAGGLVAAGQFIGKDSILSGPAGGVVGVGHIAKKTGHKKIIGFDMGGTSTDICRYNQEPEYRFEMEVNDPKTDAGSRIVAPMLAIETVAAGGGSICSFDGIRLTVGPDSAGADPGPACYGNDGPLTVTDCNLFLGRITADGFSFPLYRSATLKRLHELKKTMSDAAGFDLSLPEIALGFLKIAASNMAQPILKMSMNKGYDVREYSLVSFGGAGAQHACEIASLLGMRTVLQHPLASVLSAWGIGHADTRKQLAADYGKLLTDVSALDLDLAFERLDEQLGLAFAKEPEGHSSQILFTHSLDLRYTGQDSLINIVINKNKGLRELFEEQHFLTFGFIFPARNIEIRNIRSEGIVKLAANVLPLQEVVRTHTPTALKTTKTWFNQSEFITKIFDRASLSAGALISGPALITDLMTTSVLEPGWQAKMLAENILEFSTIAGDNATAFSPELDPVNLALFSNRFTSIAEQMGAVLQRTSLSVNVKERLDFSCAVFSAEGGLVVNAPHIPVHLGSMGDTVRAVLAQAGAGIAAGDVFVTNDPYAGGSHLPDVTVITPVFSTNGRLLFFTANRAHHAEIGGITPGSMPPESKTLAEEGVLIRNFRLVHKGQSAENALRKLLTEAPYPSRNVEDNMSDINAQIAANEIGRRQLLDVVEQIGQPVVIAYMEHIRTGACQLMTAALTPLIDHVHKFCDHMDEGTPLVLEIRPSQTPGKIVTFDFTGTGAVSPGNTNANMAIVKSAVLYSLRCLIDKDVPLNEGVLDPVEFIVPTPSILNPGSGSDPGRLPAVTAGNVETSQRIVDITLGALGLAAASQGTMNNLLFGKAKTATERGFGYYETICGGSGAGPGFDGTDAVHTHMTNTRITDPEVLEERFPVRLRRFEIRKESAGSGKWSGGNGVIREIEFLDVLELSLISNRRTTVPFGLSGGNPGSPGQNLLKRNGDPDFKQQPPSFQTSVAPGDILLILTPGGGGYGKG